MVKVHARGGHGHYFAEQQNKFRRQEETRVRIERAQEARVRKITAQAEREVMLVNEKFNAEIIPMIARVKINLEKKATSGGLNQNAYLIRILAIDEFAMREIKKRMSENKVINPHLNEIDFNKHRPLSETDRTTLLASIIGKKPTISKQRMTLSEIQRLSHEVPRWALGTI